MPDPTPEELRGRLDLLAAGQVELRSKIDVLASGQAILAQAVAVGEAKGDERAKQNEQVIAKLDHLEDAAGPMRTYFEAQNKAAAEREAQKKNTLEWLASLPWAKIAAYVGPPLTAGLVWWSQQRNGPVIQNVTTTNTVQDTPSSEPSDLPGGDGE